MGTFWCPVYFPINQSIEHLILLQNIELLDWLKGKKYWSPRLNNQLYGQ